MVPVAGVKADDAALAVIRVSVELSHVLSHTIWSQGNELTCIDQIG